MTRSVQPLVNGNVEVTIPIYIRREGNRGSMNKHSGNDRKEDGDIFPLRHRLIMGFQLLDKREILCCPPRHWPRKNQWIVPCCIRF